MGLYVLTFRFLTNLHTNKNYALWQVSLLYFLHHPGPHSHTLEEAAAVKAKVDDDALTKAIEAVKCAVR